MNDLAIGNIYKITCNLDPSIYYIGSTFSSIARRFKIHQQTYKTSNRTNIAIYEYFYKYGIDNFSISLIKSYKVVRTHNKDVKHLQAYEQLWMNKLKKCCNKKKAFNPLFKIADRESKLKYGRKQSTKDRKKIYDKQYKEQNKEKLKVYQEDYRAKNRELVKKKQQEYRAKRKLEKEVSKSIV